jgi:hypothetical protein
LAQWGVCKISLEAISWHVLSDSSTISLAQVGQPVYVFPIEIPMLWFSRSLSSSFIYCLYRWVERTPPWCTHWSMEKLRLVSPSQGSKLAVTHGNQNVTWATWKRRKIAQLAIKNSSSPVSLNYRLSDCIVIVLLLPVQLKCF